MNLLQCDIFPYRSIYLQIYSLILFTSSDGWPCSVFAWLVLTPYEHLKGIFCFCFNKEYIIFATVQWLMLPSIYCGENTLHICTQYVEDLKRLQRASEAIKCLIRQDQWMDRLMEILPCVLQEIVFFEAADLYQITKNY